MPGRRIGPRKRLALELFSGLYADKVREHRLDTLFWECTLRCNLACRHCGSDCRTDPGVKDMPAEDFLRVLDEEVTPHVDPAGVLVILSGGEVLVRDDLERIGSEIARRGYPWGMVTNGLALTPERLHGLIRAGLRTISVSLDGFEREHNRIRCNPASFARAMDAVRHIVREPELAFDVVTCVTEPLVPRLEAFRDRLVAEGVAALLDLPCGTRQRRRNTPPDRCRFPHAARLHPPYAPRRAHRRQLCLRGLSGRVRGGGARPFLPMRRRGLRGFGAGGRLDFGLHVDPCEFPSGQYLPRPLLGGVAVAFRTLPRPGVDAPRLVCRLRGFPLLPGRRNAFA